MQYIIAILIIYIIFLLILLFVHNKIIKDNKKILQTISQAIDNIIYDISTYIHNNSAKISDKKTLEEVIFNSQKQYINSSMNIKAKKIFYGKLVDNLDYIHSLTGDNLTNENSKDSINKGFEIIQNNQKISSALKVIISIGSIGILYLFCEKL